MLNWQPDALEISESWRYALTYRPNKNTFDCGMVWQS
jgi:hypothetical protein